MPRRKLVLFFPSSLVYVYVSRVILTIPSPGELRLPNKSHAIGQRFFDLALVFSVFLTRGVEKDYLKCMCNDTMCLYMYTTLHCILFFSILDMYNSPFNGIISSSTARLAPGRYTLENLSCR